MEFYAVFNQQTNGKVHYDFTEMSFSTRGHSELFCTITFGDSYLGLDLASDEETICSISGFSPSTTWQKTSLTLPEASRGTLKLSSINIVKGCGYSYSEKWCVYYDFKKDLILIADTEYRDGMNADLWTVKFLDNATGVFADRKLVYVYIENAKTY